MSNATLPDCRFLHRILLADAATSGAMGLLLTVAAGPLSTWLGLPAVFLRGAGLVLLPFAAAVVFVATRARMPRPLVWAVVAMNALWVLQSAILLASGTVEPSLLGFVFVIAQALVVAAFAELEVVGLRRAAPAVA